MESCLYIGPLDTRDVGKPELYMDVGGLGRGEVPQLAIITPFNR